MDARPELNDKLDADTFRSYYYLQQELIDFCRKNALPVSGGKRELTDRIACFLETGKIPAFRAKRKTTARTDMISEDAIACWKYKKSLSGHNRYERSDLTALDL